MASKIPYGFIRTDVGRICWPRILQFCPSNHRTHDHFWPRSFQIRPLYLSPSKSEKCKCPDHVSKQLHRLPQDVSRFAWTATLWIFIFSNDNVFDLHVSMHTHVDLDVLQTLLIKSSTDNDLLATSGRPKSNKPHFVWFGGGVRGEDRPSWSRTIRHQSCHGSA